MKKLELLTVFFLCSLVGLSTPQIPDLLIFEKDTIMLYAFPFESLNIKKAPFYYGRYPFPHTGCWRGYQATWKIIDNKLFLVQVIKVDSTKEKLDIIKYLKENNFSPTIIEGLVFADWYSAKFRRFMGFNSRFRYYISAEPKILFPLLEIKNGHIIKNRLNAL